MALQRLRVSSEENSPTEQITSLGLFIPSKDRQASWDLWDAGEGRDASTAHCRHTWSLTTKTTEWLDGTLSPCRMLGSLCGTTVSFRWYKSTLYRDFFTNGGSTIYSKVCSGPAVLLLFFFNVMAELSESAWKDDVAETSMLLILISLIKGTTYMLYTLPGRNGFGLVRCMVYQGFRNRQISQGLTIPIFGRLT